MTTALLLLALACGQERQSQKVLADHEAAIIDRDPLSLSVEALAAWPIPGALPVTRLPEESRVVKLRASIVAVKLEADGDFHVVIKGRTGATMIAEIPDPACLDDSVAPEDLRKVRAAFVSLWGRRVTTKLRRARRPIEVILWGVPFFDRIHGQTGVAPNGIELHPVLSIDPLPAPLARRR